jgi:NADPH:quinone reductase-like Zn-dependent oxidoreductase
MKAVVYQNYGPPNVLRVTEVEKPKPNDDEILVKIHAASVTSGDVRLRSSDFPPLFWLPARLIFGLFKPKKKILGHELAGNIEEIGKNIKKFNVGDNVFGTTTMLKTGSYAEYICLPQEWKHGVIEKKPKNLSFNEAAVLPIGTMTAMFLLNKASSGLEKKAEKVLIYGASGSVGSFAIQIAAQRGATVTAVCSGSNFEMVKSLGAEKVMDYKQEDYSQCNEKFDIVFDAVGKTTKSKAKKVLNSDGAFVSVKMLTKERGEHLRQIRDLVEEGKLYPYIDKIFTLDEIVSAHEYVDSGRKRGNVVIEMQQQNGNDL